MCCNSSSHNVSGGHCGCRSHTRFQPMLWSRKKQIQHVKDTISCLQDQVADLEDKLHELERESNQEMPEDRNRAASDEE